MKISAVGQHVLIAATVLPLFATTIICLTRADASLLTPFAPFGIAKVFTSARIIIFSFFGFECCASLYTVMQNPTRDVPRALILSILFVGAIYFFFMVSLILAVPLHYFSDPLIPISSVLKQIFPQQEWLILLIHTSILAATLGTIHAMQWGTSELLHVLVRKIAFLRPIVPFMTTQCSAILLGGLLFLPLLFFQNLNLFFSCTAIGVAGAYLLSIMTLFFIKQEWKLTRLIVPIIAVGTIVLILGFSIENIIEELK
jgi:amino acid transporter